MDLDDDYENELAPVVTGKARAKAKKAVAPLVSSTGVNAAGRSIEQTYQKKSQLEHILLRPDTYVGSVEKQSASMWVHVAGSEPGALPKLEQRTISYVPGLYKIFDEILVNAADNKVRDPTMTCVRVDVDAAAGTIRVYNDGDGIPVEMHKEEHVYVPELIFGHLLTSSNYDDTEKKIVGGRNGYGAKLANIFSKEFVIETCDGKRGRRYRQVFRNNMSVKGEPVITACKSTDNWTCITFKPDLAKFGMTELEEDTVALMRKRVCDVAGTIGKNTKVYLNGEKLPIKGFSDYVNLYLGNKDASQRCYEKVNDRWEICIAVSEGQFQQVSFVNSINTVKGGTHANAVADAVSAKLLERINKKNKSANVKPFQVKSHLWVFVNALIENPAFESQTKETLSTKASSFGSKCEISEEFLKKVVKTGIVESVLAFAAFKQSKELKKTDGKQRGRLTGIPKLDDANEAGGRNSDKCTLILTEGDSAKALAISGLSVVGRDYYGVFPLRGKLLNVRDATHQQIMANAEISNIKQILGLQHGKEYKDLKTLRYGQLMIMTDQDHDGSHIKGLLINFLHAHFPSLLKIPNFLVEFITPIIKATKGKQRVVFHTMPEYETWKEAQGSSTKGWAIKYYKGLGTSTAAEAKEYFAAMDANTKPFQWDGEEDGELIDMAFSRKKVDDRKRWLRAFKPGTFLDHRVSAVRYDDFINKELILFSIADLQRSIPSVMDGLKPSQRKVMFACFKRKLRTDIKVAQLSGYVSEHSAYHHGEASLASTIVGLAQDFVGANNVNMLVPSGQFGTRLQGGKDHASPRYIFTRLAPLARALFPEADDALLHYLNDDGQRIEPDFYLPILPLLLVNGADGIGTGWSTSVPNYNPLDLVGNLKRMLDGEAPELMHPWYRNFRGVIQPAPDAKAGERAYTVCGCVRVLDDTTIEVTELPLQSWTQDYKEFLEGLVRPEKKEDPPFIHDYKEYHTDTQVRFVITLPADNLVAAIANGLEKKFKLTSRISTSNMHAFDADGRITKYASPEAVLQTFFAPRLEAYSRRREVLLAAAGADLKRLENKMRFILEVVDGKLLIAKRKRAELEGDLKRRGYDALGKGVKAGAAAAAAAAADDDEADGAAAVDGAPAEGATFDYLLSMPLWSLTLEKVSDLQSEHGSKAAEVARLRATTPSELWRADLDGFLVAYEAAEAEIATAEAALVKQQGSYKAGKAGAGKAAAKKKTVAYMDVDDSEEEYAAEEESDDEDFGSKKKKKAAAGKGGGAKGGASGAPPPPPPSVARPCAAADLYEAARVKAAAALAAALAAPPKPPRAPKADPSSGGLTGALDAMDLGGEVTSPRAAVKAAPRKRAPAGQGKPRGPAKPKKPASDDEPDLSDAQDSDEDDFSMSLAQRLALRAGGGGAAMPSSSTLAAAKPRPGRAAAAKASFIDLSQLSEGEEEPESDADSDAWGGSDEDEPEEAPKPRATKKPAPPAAAAAAAAAAAKPAAKPRAKKAAAVVVSDDEASASEASDSDEASPPPKKKAAPAAKKPAAPAAAAAPARKRVLTKKPAAAAPASWGGGESEGPTPAPKKACRKRPEEEDDDDVCIVEAPAPRAAPRPGRAAAVKKYAVSESEDEEEDSGDDFDGDDSD